MLSNRKHKEKVLATKTGFCVYSPFLMDKRVSQLKNPHEFRDRKTKGKDGTELKKKSVGYKIEKYWQILGKLSPDPSPKAFELQKRIHLRMYALEKEYSLVGRTGYGNEAVSKFEIMVDIVAPFAFEIRDKILLEEFLNKKYWNSDSSIYLECDTHLRPQKEVVRDVVGFVLFEVQPINIGEVPRKNNFSGQKISRAKYEKMYQQVYQAYTYLKKVYAIRKFISKKLQNNPR